MPFYIVLVCIFENEIESYSLKLTAQNLCIYEKFPDQFLWCILNKFWTNIIITSCQSVDINRWNTCSDLIKYCCLKNIKKIKQPYHNQPHWKISRLVNQMPEFIFGVIAPFISQSGCSEVSLLTSFSLLVQVRFPFPKRLYHIQKPWLSQ